MSKFKVGDRVVVVDLAPENGKRGKVQEISTRSDWPIEVKFDGDFGSGLLKESELELEEVYDALSAPSGEDVIISHEIAGAFFDKVMAAPEPEVDSRLEGDEVNPSHYKSHPSGVECKDVAGHYSFFVGSAFKYLWRHLDKHDDPITDLRKAKQFIEFEIERLGGPV